MTGTDPQTSRLWRSRRHGPPQPFPPTCFPWELLWNMCSGSHHSTISGSCHLGKQERRVLLCTFVEMYEGEEAGFSLPVPGPRKNQGHQRLCHSLQLVAQEAEKVPSPILYRLVRLSLLSADILGQMVSFPCIGTRLLLLLRASWPMGDRVPMVERATRTGHS